MNYITLKLGGKERGAKLGLGFLRHLTESKKMSFEDVLNSAKGVNAFLAIPEFIYLSLSYNAKRKGEKFDYTLDDVSDWIDEEGGFTCETVKNFQQALTSSLGVDEEVKKALEEGKGKPQGKVAKK